MQNPLKHCIGSANPFPGFARLYTSGIASVKPKTNCYLIKFTIISQRSHTLLKDIFGKAKLIIGAANVICGEGTWSPLIKMEFGHF